MMGYIVLGIAFGLVMNQFGFNLLWAVFMSVFIYAGSLQFVLAGLLAQGSPLVTIAITTLAVNSRHIFYGLSFIETFKRMGHRRPYLMFSLTDETYALFCSLPPDQKDPYTMGMIAVMNQLYWITGTLIGSVLGEVIPFELQGVDFAMTALFTVIVVDQLRFSSNKSPAVIGAMSSVIFLLLLGPDKFLLPALSVSVVALSLIPSRFLNRST